MPGELWAGRGADFRGLFVPDSARTSHRSHLATIVRRGLKSATGDMLAILRRGRELTDGAAVRFTSSAALKVADGGKWLTYANRQANVFGDAWDHQFARDRVLEARDHFVAPDNAAAFGAHDTAQTARLRHAACDFVIALLEEARSQFEAWEPAG